MAASKDLEAGFCKLRLSSTVCARFVRRVNVECCDLKPCCEGVNVRRHVV